MSSFLDSFNDDHYSNTKKGKIKKKTPKHSGEDAITASSDNEIIDSNNEVIVPDNSESYLPNESIDIKYKDDDIENDTDNSMSAMPPKNNQVRVDPNFQKAAKYKRYRIIGGVTIALLLFIVAIIFSRLVTVPNFIGKNVSDVKKWAAENNINVDSVTEFSLDQQKDFVIKQKVDEGAKVFTGSVFSITVSLGVDPDELIELPDFKTMTFSETQEYIEKYKLSNIVLSKNYSSKIDSGKFISLKFEDDMVDITNYRRKDKLEISYSKGVKPIVKDIKVPDFLGMSVIEANQWASKNKVDVTYIEGGSNLFAAGLIYEQDTSVGTLISNKETIQLSLSKGTPVIVPNYYGYTTENAAQAEPAISINVRTAFSSSVSFGNLISQSSPAGSYLYGEGSSITLVFSEGPPFIGPLKGKNQKEVEEYFAELNQKGANVRYNMVPRKDDSAERNTVVGASVENDYVGFGQTVKIYIAE